MNTSWTNRLLATGSTDNMEDQSPSISTRSSFTQVDIKTTCLFCDGSSQPGNKLVSACTKEIGPTIHEQAVEMQNTQVLAKIASTDFIALEVKYHCYCYTQFRNSYRSHRRSLQCNASDPNRLTYGAVISELVQYMEEMFIYSDTAPVFKLSHLTQLLAKRMTTLGVSTDERSISGTRLKELIWSPTLTLSQACICWLPSLLIK